MLREVRARNPSAMTLDGTRTWLVGERMLAIIDPGPALPAHMDAIARHAAKARTVSILVTHAHPDHAEAAAPLAARLRAGIHSMADGTLADGQQIVTDNGPLVALHTPGHTADHVCFEWPARRAVFCGDLMMGGLDTALVAPPEGDLFEYLASLERIRAREPDVIYPAHGEPLTNPEVALDRYVAHRAMRRQQVLEILAAGSRSTEQVAASVYAGTVAADLHDVAMGAARAYLDYLQRAGLIKCAGGLWMTIPA